MINTTKIDKIKEKAHLPPFQKQSKGIFVFPMTIAGTLDNTNAGQLPMANNKADNYNYLERIFIGDRPIFMYWENSISGISQKEDIYLENDTNPPVNKTTHQLFTMKVGTTLSGMFMDETEGAEIEDEATFQDYKVLRINQKITLRFEPSTMNVWDEELEPQHGFQWDVNSYYKLYLIEGYGKNFFRLLNATPTKDVRDNQKIISWECEFEYMGNTLQKTGQAYENYLQHGYFVGGGYAYPKIYFDKDGNKKVCLDKDLLKHEGVSHVKVEKLGNACIGSFVLLGNELIGENDSKWGGITQPKIVESDTDGNPTRATFKFYNPKHIYPNHVFPTNSNSLYRRQAPTNNFGIMFKTYLSLTADYDKWKEQIPNKLKANTKYTWEGTIQCDSNGTTYDLPSFNIWSGTKWDDTNNKIYWSKNPIDLTNAPDYTYMISVVELGTEFKFNSLPNKDKVNFSVWNLINHYLGNEIVSLPLSQNVNLTSYVKDWPFAGKLFNMVLGGIQLGVSGTDQSTFYNYNAYKLPNFLIDNEAYTFGKMTYTATNDSKFPAELLKYGDDNKNSQDVFSLASQVNVSYLCNLNHLIEFGNGQHRDAFTLETEFDTSTPANSTHPSALHLTTKDKDIYKLQNVQNIPDQPFIVEPLPYQSNKRYIICGAENFDLFNGVVKLTTYSNDNYFINGILESQINSNFTFSLMTNANWRNSLREWKTEIQLNALPWIQQSGELVYFPANIIGNGQQGGTVKNWVCCPFNSDTNSKVKSSNNKIKILNWHYNINEGKQVRDGIYTGWCDKACFDAFSSSLESDNTTTFDVQYHVIKNIQKNDGETLKNAILRQYGNNFLIINNRNSNKNQVEYGKKDGKNWKWNTDTKTNSFLTVFNGKIFNIKTDIIDKMDANNSVVIDIMSGINADFNLWGSIMITNMDIGNIFVNRQVLPKIHFNSATLTFTLNETQNAFDCEVKINYHIMYECDKLEVVVVSGGGITTEVMDPQNGSEYTGSIFNNHQPDDHDLDNNWDETGNNTYYEVEWDNFIII